MAPSNRRISRSLAQHGGSAGGGLIALASRRGGVMGVLLAIVGAGLLYKAVSAGRAQTRRLPSAPDRGRDIHLSSSVSINRSAADIYKFWRDFSNLPKVMSFLEKVEPRDDGRVTKVSLSFNFKPPGGVTGSATANFLRSLESSVLSKNLRNLKAQLETGEIPTNSQFDGKTHAGRRPS